METLAGIRGRLKLPSLGCRRKPESLENGIGTALQHRLRILGANQVTRAHASAIVAFWKPKNFMLAVENRRGDGEAGSQTCLGLRQCGQFPMRRLARGRPARQLGSYPEPDSRHLFVKQRQSASANKLCCNFVLPVGRPRPKLRSWLFSGDGIPPSPPPYSFEKW